MLWRPLPIAAPERLYVLSRELTGAGGKSEAGDVFAYPMFRQMRATVQDQAEMIAISVANRIDLTYGSDQETEKAYQQYVSGWIFDSFGIRPAAGRVFSESDDLKPGAHPYAVLSYDYWKRRFGGDRSVIGKTYRAGNEIYQIVGVADGPFTGTEPGRVTDIFVPTMMMKNNAIARSDYQWFRAFVHLRPGVSPSPIRGKLRPVFQAFLEERAKASSGVPERERARFLDQRLLMNPASAGVSGTQRYYRTALSVLGILVSLVLFISCANVANLITAQAAARQREMALRTSLGAGRWRLVQLMVVECALLAFIAACIGGGFAWWAAPWIVEMIGTPDNPARVILPADWRVLGFGVTLAFVVTILFGLGPALRASGVKPAVALRGGDPHTRPRMMRLLIGAQVAFCVLVLFVTGLFMATSGRLMHQRTGFSAERLLTLETVTPQPQPDLLWEQVAARLRAVPGVEAVAICEWPLLTGGSWSGFISVNGSPPGPVPAYLLSVSPEWREVMKIPLLQGRDLRAADTSPGSVLVNEAFARQFFGAENPEERSFDVVSVEGQHKPYRVAGVVGDARYRDMRESIQPTVFFPFKAKYGRATFMVRTASRNALAMASVLRTEVRAGRFPRE